MTQPAETAVTVEVVRTGGVAGLVRRWAVAAPPGDPGAWAALVDDCPWEGEPGAAARSTGADRFTWEIDCRRGGDHRRVRLSEAEAAGPWRALIDAVRAGATAPASPPEE